MEVLIEASILINIFCLIESVSLRAGEDSNQEFEINAFFLIALLFQVLFMFIVVGLIIAYYVIWKPSYNIRAGVDWLLDPFEWRNKKCDEHFAKKKEDLKKDNIHIIPFGE